MKKVLLLFGFSAFSMLTTFAQNVQWAKASGASGNDVATSVTTDASGNAYVTGWFRNSLTLGSNTLVSKGNDDIFVYKSDSDGVIQWAFSHGGIGEDRGYGIKVDASGNIYVTGHFSGTDSVSSSVVLVSKGQTDLFVAKYNSSGTLQWASSGGSTSADRVNGMTMDANNNVYIAGWYGNFGGPGGGTTTATFGSSSITTVGQQDGFAAAVNSSGSWQWATNIGGRQRDVAFDIFFNSRNNTLTVAGSYSDTMNVSASTLRSNGSSDAFFVVLGSGKGNILNGLGVGGRQLDNGYAVGQDVNGNLYLGGTFTGSIVIGGKTYTANATGNDAFLISLDKNYGIRWSEVLSGSGNENINKISGDALGNVFITGNFSSTTLTVGGISLTNKGGNDAIVINIDSMATINWVSHLGGTGNDDSRQVAVWNENQYVVGAFNATGSVGGTATVGTQTLVAKDSSEAFLYKIFVCPGLSSKLTASGPTDFCSGDSVILGASASAAQWQWYMNGNIMTGDTNAQVTIKSSGIYTCELISSTSCKMTTQGITVNVGTPPGTSISATGSSICGGDSVLLTAGSGPNYQFRFYRNDTAVTNWVSSSFYYAKIAGIYKVEVNNYGCKAFSDTVGLSLIATPSITITLTGSATICPGDTVVLNSDTNSGWTYYWTRNAQIINNSTSSTLIVTQGGQYRVVVGLPNGCTVSSNIITITTPNGVTVPTLGGFPGTLPLCFGDSARLAVQTQGPPNPNAQYQWYLDNNPITGATTRFYTVKTSGKYKASLTAGGCTIYTRDTIFTFSNASASLTPNGNAVLCQGGKLTLTATGDAGSTYQWFQNGTAINGATSATYDVTIQGNYTVSVKLGNCTWKSPIANVTSVPGPTVPTILQNVNQLACNITATSYQWYVNSSPIPNSNSQYIYGWQTGFYQVEIFDNNGCAAKSPLFNFINNAVEDAPAFEFRAFPNPANQILNFELPTGTNIIRILDMTGKLVLIQSFNGGNSSMEMTNLPSGLYLIQAIHDGNYRHQMIQIAR